MMLRWQTRRAYYSVRSPRLYSSHHGRVETVVVPCASSGEITLSLRNVSAHSSQPLLVCLPPFSGPGSAESALPSSLAAHPSVEIHYRWPGSARGLAAPSSEELPPLLRWPTPLHDVLFGYSWITRHLCPPSSARRDVYLYGSYLGATLAASVALTECYPHQPMAVRGLAALNGIYNWTAFLPDHPMHRSAAAEQRPFHGAAATSAAFCRLAHELPALFSSPADLFDPFASPSLLFHSPGLLVPDDFGSSALSTAASATPLEKAVDELSMTTRSLDDDDGLLPLKAPRKGYLAFPPRKSPLRIPEALLVHESSRPADDKKRSRAAARKGRRRVVPSGEKNSFGSHAAELGALMRRSVEKLELAERRKWDDEFEDWDGEAARRVHVVEAGEPGADNAVTDNPATADAVAAWLEERLGGRGE